MILQLLSFKENSNANGLNLSPEKFVSKIFPSHVESSSKYIIRRTVAPKETFM